MHSILQLINRLNSKKKSFFPRNSLAQKFVDILNSKSLDAIFEHQKTFEWYFVNELM